MSITISRKAIQSLEGKESSVRSVFLWLMANRRGEKMRVAIRDIQHGLVHDRGGATERPGAQVIVNALSMLCEAGIIGLRLTSPKGQDRQVYSVQFLQL